jgi:hypothetical protein
MSHVVDSLGSASSRWRKPYYGLDSTDLVNNLVVGYLARGCDDYEAP